MTSCSDWYLDPDYVECREVDPDYAGCREVDPDYAGCREVIRSSLTTSVAETLTTLGAAVPMGISAMTRNAGS